MIKTLDASHIFFNILMVTSYLTVLTLNLTACCATAGFLKGNYNILTEIGFQKVFFQVAFKILSMFLSQVTEANSDIPHLRKQTFSKAGIEEPLDFC